MKLLAFFFLLRFIPVPCALAITVAEITGNRYLSRLNGTSFGNLTGLVTSSLSGAIRSTQPDDDESTSESINVFNPLVVEHWKAGNIITLDGDVETFRGWPRYIVNLQISNARNVRWRSSGNPVEPVEMGGSTSGIIGDKDMRPPTEQYSKLDDGNVFGIPNSVARIMEVNPRLEPRQYGMDFFQSLNAELVTVRNVTALGRRAYDMSWDDTRFWVYGNWPVSGRNARGGLTFTDRDANPENLPLFPPADGTSNPNTTKLGDSLTDITGFINYINGLYYLQPLTAPSIQSSRSPALPPPSTIRSNGRCDAVSFADYKLENFAPGDSRIPLIVDHIATYLGAPSIISLQGVQDSSGDKDDGTVDADVTLSGLATALERRTGIPYQFINIDPVNNADDWRAGPNLRNAYLFNPLHVRLHRPKPGNATDIEAVLPGPSLRFNPGRIDALYAFEICRKPLIAQWETVDGKGTFFTVNVQWIDKSDGDGLWDDSRPPWNPNLISVDPSKPNTSRETQSDVTAAFVAQILEQDKDAAVIAAGDFEEYDFVGPLKHFAQVSGLLDLDVVAQIPELERYTSSSNPRHSGSQDQLAHMYVSQSIARGIRRGDFEHVHVNTWAGPGEFASDFDPSVARLNVCKQ